jgi:electron transport complex protein RnfA
MLVFAIASAVGYSLALILFAGIRERFEISRIPKSLAGTAIGLVTAGLMSLAFFSFLGMG